MMALRNAARAFSSASASEPVLRTALYSRHQALGGKLVEFAGYWLPVQYPAGVLQEHLHTRKNASLFDVSHMGQVRIYGEERVKYLEKLVVGEIAELAEGHSRLSMLTNENGGIMDDTVISNAGDHIFMVVNGACKKKDLAHMMKHAEGYNCKLEHLDQHALLALQGPKAIDVLSKLTTTDVGSLAFMEGTMIKIGEAECRVTRCGYTGEDGFEISVPNEDAGVLMDTLLDNDIVMPAGLGARDSLRLESGLCLYGNDLDETTTPAEGTLMWTIGKRRRAEANFLGGEKIMEQFKTKSAERKRVGLMVNGAPARGGADIYDEAGENKIGTITSGSFSPCLKKPIAMGYVAPAFSKAGTNVMLQVRKKMVPATISKMPFVPTNYHK